MKEQPDSPAPPQSKLASPRFGSHVPIDSSKIQGRSYGGILLYYRDAIFDKIQRSESLNGMIAYFMLWSIIFAAAFGCLLGFFSRNLQIVSGALKVPILLWGSLAICLPALFTFNVLLGSKLSFKQTAAVLAMTTYLISTVLVSLSPIVFFFIICASVKGFVILLTVIAFSIAGLFGVSLLWNAMGYLTERAGYAYDSKIIKAWTVIYMFVGTQFAWILRPFVGDPGEFAWLRTIGGNFYTGLFQIITDLFTKG